MEIRISGKQILNVLKVLSWIIFLGLCVEAGGILFNTVYVLYKPAVATYFWNGANLSPLYTHDKGWFLTLTGQMFIAAVLKALIFYLILKMFYDKKFSLAKPFTSDITGIVFNIAYLCLGAGIFSLWGARNTDWLKEQGVAMPDIESLRIAGGDVWLFMAVVLLVIGQVFKKGTELQTESDLTV